MTETCRHGTGAPRAMLEGLPESQGGLGRHKCASCAYDLALKEINNRVASQGRMVRCSHGKLAPRSILLSLGDNQGGAGRHKCVVCAYQKGRASGRGISDEAAWAPKFEKESGAMIRVETPKAPVQDGSEILSNVDENRKKAIGDLGEALVLDLEKSALLMAGRADLANRIVHVAVEEGDSAGYDIRSYDLNGKVRYIEVKTTIRGGGAAFFLTANEHLFAETNFSDYYIYRLFELKEEKPSAKFFVAHGALEEHFELTPVEYRVLPKSKVK